MLLSKKRGLALVLMCLGAHAAAQQFQGCARGDTDCRCVTIHGRVVLADVQACAAFFAPPAFELAGGEVREQPLPQGQHYEPYQLPYSPPGWPRLRERALRIHERQE